MADNLESNVDFEGWQYLSRNSEVDPRKIGAKKVVVRFDFFHDLLGRDEAGNIKPKNTWVHKVKCDLAVFDEYHFGAWRDTAKELFEGEEQAVAKKEAKLEYAAGLKTSTETSVNSSSRNLSSCPSLQRPTSTYPARPFRALSTGEFIAAELTDVITKLERDLFLAVTGLTVKDFYLLVRLKVFNTEKLNMPCLHFGGVKTRRYAIRESKAMRA